MVYKFIVHKEIISLVKRVSLWRRWRIVIFANHTKTHRKKILTIKWKFNEQKTNCCVFSLLSENFCWLIEWN